MIKPIYDVVRGILPSSALEQEAWEYQIRSTYSNPTAIETLLKYNFDSEELVGSSPFLNLELANMNPDKLGILPNGHRLATREDIEFMASKQPDYFDGIYSDFGLALITGTDSYEPNKLLTENLYEQLKKREIELTKGGIFIPSSILGKPVEDNNSAYGLLFQINPDLNSKEARDQIKPILDSNWYWIGNEGLARAYRGYRQWNRDNRLLGASSSYGRVVGVVGAQKDLGLGNTNEERKSDFEQAGVSASYQIVKPRLPDNN